MTRVTLESPYREKLNQFTIPVEFCDEQGRVIGTFIPNVDESRVISQEPPLDEKELKRRMNSDRWYTTEEVLNHLKQL